MERTIIEKANMYAVIKLMYAMMKMNGLDNMYGNAINDLQAAVDEVKTIEYEMNIDLDKLAEENTHDCDAPGCNPQETFKEGFNTAINLLRNEM